MGNCWYSKVLFNLILNTKQEIHNVKLQWKIPEKRAYKIRWQISRHSVGVASGLMSLWLTATVQIFGRSSPPHGFWSKEHPRGLINPPHLNAITYLLMCVWKEARNCSLLRYHLTEGPPDAISTDLSRETELSFELHCNRARAAGKCVF